MANSQKNILGLLIILLSFLLLTGCYTHKLVASPDADNVIRHKRTTWGFIWGFVDPKDIQAQCENGGISNVATDNTFFHSLLTVASVGVVNPNKITWDCMPEATSDDTLPEE